MERHVRSDMIVTECIMSLVCEDINEQKKKTGGRGRKENLFTSYVLLDWSNRSYDVKSFMVHVQRNI